MYLQRADVSLPSFCFTILTSQALSCSSLMITAISLLLPPCTPSFFQAGILLTTFRKNIGKSQISNIKQQLSHRLELYRNIRKDKKKGARGVFSAHKKCIILDVAKSKQEIYIKFLPQELSFPKDWRLPLNFLVLDCLFCCFQVLPQHHWNQLLM